MVWVLGAEWCMHEGEVLEPRAPRLNIACMHAQTAGRGLHLWVSSPTQSSGVPKERFLELTGPLHRAY